MNYIKHLSGVFLFMDNDHRLTPFHISLYMVLFRQWNNNRFKNPISIARDEMMKASKIGSVNTYTKTLKQLHQYQYIRYEPSFNPHIGSRIYLYTFENARDQATDTADEIEMSPLLNIENITKLSNKINKKIQAQKIEKQDNNMKETNTNQTPNPNDIPPPMEHLIIYFNEKEFTATEAEKFYNYFQSNGWLIGGKAPMKDWKAAARNWMLNAKKFNKNGTKPAVKTTPSPGKLHTETFKNYEEPL